MGKRQRPTGAAQGRRDPRIPRWLVVLVIAAGVSAAAAVGALGMRPSQTPASAAPATTPASETPGPSVSAPPLTDVELQRAADELLAAADPRLPQNKHFTPFAAERLMWMSREVTAGRLTVAFLADAESIGIPPSVMMAATQLDGQPTIFIAKPRFATFLAEAGASRGPFGQQQRNDFSVALVHETVHLQRWKGKPVDVNERVREESFVWREVTLHVVRPWRALGQPLHPRFVQVDDAFKACGDQLPCAAIGRFAQLKP